MMKEENRFVKRYTIRGKKNQLKNTALIVNNPDYCFQCRPKNI